jgi:hypothetical protein
MLLLICTVRHSNYSPILARLAVATACLNDPILEIHECEREPLAQCDLASCEISVKLFDLYGFV